MRKLCRCTVVLGALFTLGLLVATTPRPAQARQPYLGWWSEMYPDVAKKDEVKSLKCNVCHVGTTSKKNRNEYGKALAKALAPKRNLKKNDANKEIFDEVLKKVAKQKSATPDKTFGDLLDAGELPAPQK